MREDVLLAGPGQRGPSALFGRTRYWDKAPVEIKELLATTFEMRRLESH